jgi:hypothetical protein
MSLHPKWALSSVAGRGLPDPLSSFSSLPFGDLDINRRFDFVQRNILIGIMRKAHGSKTTARSVSATLPKDDLESINE